jgi:predicted RNA-binding protein with PIN domain
MHYFVDGYNLLFRYSSKENLKNRRDQLICELNEKCRLLDLDVTLVFDAAYQFGESSRSHYDALEIIYTAVGETADLFILEQLKHLNVLKRSNSKGSIEETVVTSDKALAGFARQQSARTETIEEFISWINHRYKNKRALYKEKKEKDQKPEEKKSIKIAKPIKKVDLKEDSLGDYLEIFERRFQEELIKEEERKTNKKVLKGKIKKEKPKKEIIPFITDMERWLRAFEKNNEP